MCKGDSNAPICEEAEEASRGGEKKVVAGDREAAGGAEAPLASFRCTPLCEGAWALGLQLSPEHPARMRRPPTCFHFVLDNSGSMGNNTRRARDCFAELLEVANGPSSLVAFDSQAKLIGKNFRTPEELKAAKLPPQGSTNITAGVEAALAVIRAHEDLEDQGEAGERAHHVLVLLSDGAHTVGPKPQQRLPEVGPELRAAYPALRLSVVVVGVTTSSNTSMGMLLKESLETVPLPMLDPIYFASTPAEMTDVLGQMHAGMASLRGSVVTVRVPEGTTLCRAVGEEGVQSMDIFAEANEQALLCFGAPPAELLVDGAGVPRAGAGAEAEGEEEPSFDAILAAGALEKLLDAVRISRVAGNAEQVRPALLQLGTWISALEAGAAAQRSEGASLQLAGASPRSRVEQHRALTRATLGARELRNRLREVEAYEANDSASQASFLTGASSKYGAKALRRAAGRGAPAAGAAAATVAGSADSQQRFRELLADAESIAPRMKQALREDFCSKVATLTTEQRQALREALRRSKFPDHVVDAVCREDVAAASAAANPEMAALMDSDAGFRALLEVIGRYSTSYLSLFTSWEHLREWSSFDASSCGCENEYQLLMWLGAFGFGIDVERRAATQMDPFAVEVKRLRSSSADTASLCCALQSNQAVYPPEGGVPLEDLLVLIDPDAPRASRLAANSLLLREAYTSVVLCRDLHMYTGNKMRVALHAHALLAAVQPKAVVQKKVIEEDITKTLQRQFLGKAFQCRRCGFGPIEHFACSDLLSHHGEAVGNAVIDNACPSCGWFAEELRSWPKWDGKVPKALLEEKKRDANDALKARDHTAVSYAALEQALRICYSARCIWQAGEGGEARALCARLANWETLTSADGVDHPVQLLLALAVVDDLPDGVDDDTATAMLLSEVCARRARDELRRTAGTEEPRVMAAARQRASALLGIAEASAPYAAPLEVSEPRREAVREGCSSAYTLSTEEFDYKSWVKECLQPWEAGLRFVRRLRDLLRARGGGWAQLMRDMETGPDAYSDLITALQEVPEGLSGLREWLGVTHARDSSRILATVAAQAFLHQSSQLRRTVAAGGALAQPLGDVRDPDTLRSICKDLRMAIYDERVAAKMREWQAVGASMTCTTARAADLEQYAQMCGTHVHGLDKATFWGLWRAARGPKAREFLSRANMDFRNKYTPPRA